MSDHPEMVATVTRDIYAKHGDRDFKVLFSRRVTAVEQDADKPTPQDLAYAKQSLLTTAPTPRYPVNADLDGKVVYLGLDANPVPAEPGKAIPPGGSLLLTMCTSTAGASFMRSAG